MREALEKLTQHNCTLTAENAALRAQVLTLQQELEQTNRKLQHVLATLWEEDGDGRSSAT